MADISMCFGEYCPRRDSCYMAMARPNKIQSYGDLEDDCRLHGYRNQLEIENGDVLVSDMICAIFQHDIRR